MGARHRQDHVYDTLTERELEVVAHMAEGLENVRVAAEMHLSAETIKSHVRHILGKLEARNRTHAVAICLRKGLIA